MSWLLATVLVIGGCIADPNAARQQSDPSSEPVPVDFELMPSMHMAVQVKINGKGPFRLIFDLGSPVVLVSGRAATESGLLSEKAAKAPALFGMRGQGKAKRIQIGEVTAEGVQVTIMDHPTVKLAEKYLGRLDGIVGYPFFARYKFTIDYQQKKMTFAPSKYVPQDVMQRMMAQMFAPAAPSVVAPAGLWGVRVTKQKDDTEPGVTVDFVWPDSPVAKAGLKPGDRILTVAGRWTDSPRDLLDAASFVTPGQAAELVVVRDEKQIQVQITPAVGL